MSPQAIRRDMRVIAKVTQRSKSGGGGGARGAPVKGNSEEDEEEEEDSFEEEDEEEEMERRMRADYQQGQGKREEMAFILCVS